MNDRQHITILHASGETIEHTIEDQSGNTATVTTTYPTYPAPEEINRPGEIAVCTLDGYESIHVKNTDNEIVSWGSDSVRGEKLANWTLNNGGLVANNLARSTNGMLSVTEGAKVSERLTLFDAGEGNEPDYAYLRTTGASEKYGVHENGTVTNLAQFQQRLEPYINFVITLVDYPESGKTYNVMVANQNEVHATPIIKGAPCTAIYCENILGLEGLDRQSPIKVSKITYSLPMDALSVASGIGSHAEGSITSANTIGTHAEGNATKTDGDYAHAEGTEGAANGIGSSSHNAQCFSNGDYSSTYGYMTHADEQGEFACGAANEYSGMTLYHWVDRIFSVGDGLCFLPHNTEEMLLTSPLVCSPSAALVVSKMKDGYDSDDGDHALTINLLPSNILITAIGENGQLVRQTLERWLAYAGFFNQMHNP